jgi:hypothetical protein
MCEYFSMKEVIYEQMMNNSLTKCKPNGNAKIHLDERHVTVELMECLWGITE